MNRRLKALDWDVPPPPRPVTWKGARKPLAFSLVAAVGVFALVQSGWFHSRARAAGFGTGSPAAGSRGNDRPLAGAPTRTHLDALHRLLPKAIAQPTSSSYRFLQRAAGQPLTFEPCRPIHYVVRHEGEPRLFDRLLHSAIAELSHATGLKFVDDGTTVELPLYSSTDRLSYQPQLYGNRWAPVLIAWSNVGESPHLAGHSGFAGPIPFATNDDPPRYVSGTVIYDLAQFQLMRGRPTGVALMRSVLLHELGHLVGLAHVPDRSEVMHPQPLAAHDHYAAGDLAGLAKLGAGPCYADY